MDIPLGNVDFTLPDVLDLPYQSCPRFSVTMSAGDGGTLALQSSASVAVEDSNGVSVAVVFLNVKSSGLSATTGDNATWPCSGNYGELRPPFQYSITHFVPNTIPRDTKVPVEVNMLPAGATPSPTASASPSVSPQPQQPPAGPVVPTPDARPEVSVQPAVISAGEPVRVTYKGTPGSTLQVLSKTQPATDFSVIRTVTLDSTGAATTTHRPQKNTRMAAINATGVQGAVQPLIQVRSTATLTATRISGRTYSMTGRVYPARDQRLVSAYVNGVLAAQGRTNTQGIYKLTKALPVGRISLLVKTGDDTYNLGTSKALSLAVAAPSQAAPALAAPRQPAPVPARATPSGCHPDYVTCVPIKGNGSGVGAVNDLDCPDIGKKVVLRQAGRDPYRLDSDDDGLGCDSY